tara:strand:- start:167 stop:424 length:258 start_codon:yes stop_codon:yes gene_type:complete
MKITKARLKEIIKEELEASMVQEAKGETPQDVANRLKNMPAGFRMSVLNDFRNMADGSTEMAEFYPHVTDLPAFAKEILRLLGER